MSTQRICSPKTQQKYDRTFKVTNFKKEYNISSIIEDDSVRFMFVLMTSYHAIVSLSVAGKVEEVCLYDTFSPECNEDEVLIVTEALYGRMNLGGCVTQNFVGVKSCSENVLPVLDQRCSGHRTCNLQVVDPTFVQAAAGCNKELTKYLKVDYQCIPGRCPGAS